MKKLKTGRPSKNIDRSYQFKICLWIALGKTTPQILDLIKDRFKIDMSYQNIDVNYRQKKRWQLVINYLRTRYLKNISRIPIANKAYRLAMLQEGVEEALTWHTKSVNQYGEVEEKKIGTLAQLINEARKEIEGEKPSTLVNVENKTIFQDIKIEDRPVGDIVRDFTNRLSERLHK